MGVFMIGIVPAECHSERSEGSAFPSSRQLIGSLKTLWFAGTEGANAQKQNFLWLVDSL